MADDTEDEWKEYPLWSRILTAVLFLAMGIGVGAALGGWNGVVAGVLLALLPALLALFVPPVLAFLAGVLEILSYCAF